MKLITYAESVGASARSAGQPAPAGTRSSSTMIVIAIATTASLNASRRCLCTLPPPGVVRVERLDLRDVRDRPRARLRIVEEHDLLIGGRERRPRRKAGAV